MAHIKLIKKSGTELKVSVTIPVEEVDQMFAEILITFDTPSKESIAWARGDGTLESCRRYQDLRKNVSEDFAKKFLQKAVDEHAIAFDGYRRFETRYPDGLPNEGCAYRFELVIPILAATNGKIPSEVFEKFVDQENYNRRLSEAHGGDAYVPVDQDEKAMRDLLKRAEREYQAYRDSAVSTHPKRKK
jgi:hypothetical protein